MKTAKIVGLTLAVFLVAEGIVLWLAERNVRKADLGPLAEMLQTRVQEALPTIIPGENGPTFYVTLRADCQTSNEIKVRGASNLPKGSVLGLVVSEFMGAAWRDYSERSFVSVGPDGLFEQPLHPKDGMDFRGNRLVLAFFSPVYHVQPESVLQFVGPKGEHLGSFRNPQVGQLSGENFYLESIARSYCNEN